MECIIIYSSKHLGNTKKIAETIAETLNCPINHVDGTTPEELEKYDIIGIGSGIYMFGMDRKLKKILKALRRDGTDKKNKKIFLFSTSADPNGLRYHNTMKKFLVKNGFILIDELNCLGEFKGWFFGKKHLNIGRPGEEEIQKAKLFATNLLNKIKNH